MKAGLIYAEKLISLFLSDLVAAELLDFIHARIEDTADAVNSEGPLGDYLDAHLQLKDAGDLGNLSKYLPKDLRIRHAIATFDFVVKKMRDRN